MGAPRWTTEPGGGHVRPVVVSGPPASGKSTLGRRLADRLGRPFVDVDAAIEADARRPIANLFADEGEQRFRELERAALLACLDRPDAPVVAVGGGALVDAALRRDVLRGAHVLSLVVPTDVLVARAADAPGARPLLVPKAGDAPAAPLERLLRARQEAYGEAHALLPGTGNLDEVAGRAVDLVLDLEQNPALVVPLGRRTYRVHVEPLARLPARVRALRPSAVVAVTDRRVARLRGPLLDELRAAVRVDLPGRGDRDKTMRAVQRIWDAALGAGVDRDAVVVGVGGGVVTDLAGFAAATLLRGLRYASAPTTLLAMIDASVGGKTGVDHARGKNLIGAFHQPSVVVCDPAAMTTQAPRDVRAGLAELVKIALVRDAGLLRDVEAAAERLAALDLAAIGALVPAAIQAKIDVVVEDEREAGVRAILNFGHTVGHALEQASGYALPHGECVALGMRAALDLGERGGVTPPDLARRGRSLLDRLGFPDRALAPIDLDQAEAALETDKKRAGGALRFVLVDGEGSGALRPVPREEAVRSLRALLPSAC